MSLRGLLASEPPDSLAETLASLVPVEVLEAALRLAGVATFTGVSLESHDSGDNWEQNGIAVWVHSGGAWRLAIRETVADVGGIISHSANATPACVAAWPPREVEDQRRAEERRLRRARDLARCEAILQDPDGLHLQRCRDLWGHTGPHVDWHGRSWPQP